MKRRPRSQAYLPADRDPEFLESDATRGVRLQMEYLKAELLLREQGIAHTILVMGSTRMKAASPYYKVAREFGRIVGRAGSHRKGARGALMTGGGPGIMEAANRGAFEVGAPSIGLNISLRREQAPNRYLTPELSLRFRYFALRKLHFLLRARAMVAFPGGFGTFDELFETLTLVQTRKIRPMPIVLVGESYWRLAFNADFLRSQGAITARDRRLFSYADSARDTWKAIVSWYRAAGEPVFPQR
jgi:uncharacterized protein (TIGR00730 family)